MTALAEPREVDGVLVFDLRHLPHALEPGEWTPHRIRRPEDLVGVVVHAWGVRSVGTTTKNRRLYGEPLALAMRALVTPYGISCGVTDRGKVPVVAIAHPVERYTFASDAGNAAYLAVGVMGLFAFEAEKTDLRRHTEATPALRKAVDVALREAAILLDEFTGGTGPIRGKLIAHRQCANDKDDHLACPGEAAVEMALASKAVRDGLLVPDPDLEIVPKYGRPWLDSWRRHLARPVPRDLDVTAAVAEARRILQGRSADELGQQGHPLGE